MKRFRKILKWTLLVFGLLIAIALIYIHNLDFSMTDEAINSALSDLPYEPEAGLISFEDRNIHYVAIGDTSKQTILFVHGSPGSWDNFLGFMRHPDLLNKFRIISVDRPGFGKSGNGNPERSLEQQAKLVNRVLEMEASTSTILVGHSFGGPVIAKMAVDYPENINGLVFVAASIDPELEKTKWFQIPVHYKILSWILPDMLYSTNEEIIALKKELEDLIPLWSSIDQPTSIIQGKKDKLVPYENALFGERMLTNTKPNLVIKDINHFIPWENPDLIIQEILRVASFSDH
ncbi:MAG: alpha/beta hydrolase [Balneola sp.]|nr:alpha/beta hydrolase [Balneola sp.]MBO6650412.1 alpha/beta hydrolase [Balneola sp.]MBO6710192.1 alpha/beta hydrolase [Balneola sp.]MBO6798877.1 alpha/beta hydrolase [Balneola sp.]MBO6869991.1 alpha/beta hydrolase [Balneola sp.]